MEIIDIVKQFDIQGDIVSIKPLGNGHINDTNLVTTTKEKYTFQRINTNIFKNPDELMDNLFAVTEYLKENFPNELTISYVRTLDGKKYLNLDGVCYRLSVFVDNVIGLDAARDANDFYESAVAFGNFQKKLADFPAETLNETIKSFHDTKWRIANLKEAAKANKSGRFSTASADYDFYVSREGKIDTGIELPLRVTHNDTKLNNVLLDEKTGKGVCVIDLDTVMPGLSINDFGDSIRFGASTAAEDEQDLSKVHFSLELYEAYVKGYFEGVGNALTNEEVMLLPHGAIMMTYECGARFLTDYFDGDVYFKTAYPEHNLVRSRTQMRLVEEMEQNYDKMVEIVQKYRP